MEDLPDCPVIFPWPVRRCDIFSYIISLPSPLIYCSANLFTMRLMDVLSTMRNIVYFDEKNYVEQNQDTPDAILARKHDKKALQLILCGGAIGAGIVASFITGSTSIVCSALSARHANILRQQQKLLSDIQQARQEQWLREAIAVEFPFDAYTSADLSTSFPNTSGLIVFKRISVVPRPLSRAVGRSPPNGAPSICCPGHKSEPGPDTIPEDASHAA